MTAPDVQGHLPPRAQEIHDAQQENLAARRDAQRRQRERRQRQIAAAMPATAVAPAPAGPRANAPPREPGPMAWIESLAPDIYRDGETILERQRRARPAADEPLISEVAFAQRVICLQPFVCRETLRGLRCGHSFHAECRDMLARAHVERQRGNAPNEAQCAACRGAGIIVAPCP